MSNGVIRGNIRTLVCEQEVGSQPSFISLHVCKPGSSSKGVSEWKYSEKVLFSHPWATDYFVGNSFFTVLIYSYDE